ncbi:MAG: hypothetical protein WCO40_11240 [Thermoleophilia bacterium]
MSRSHAYRTVGYLAVHGGRYYVRRRYPNFARNLIAAAGTVAAVGVAISVLSQIAGRSNVNSMTP